MLRAAAARGACPSALGLAAPGAAGAAGAARGCHGGAEAAFVPLAVEPDPAAASEPGGSAGAIAIEIGDVVLRVPRDVPAERAAALVRALRGVA